MRYAASSGAKIGQHILFGTGREQAYAKVRFGLDPPTFLI